MGTVTIVTVGVTMIGERLTRLRERRGWSMGALADRSGVSRAAISRIESGDTPSPGATTLAKLASALGCDVSDITGERPMPRRQVQVIEGGAAVPVWRRRVHAGGEGYWDDTTETVYVSLYVKVRHPNIKAAIVTGDCMEPWVMPGETVMFDPDQSPVDRDMVIVTDDEGDTMVKWFRLDADGSPYLQIADGTTIRPNGATIEGVVIAAYRTDLRRPEP
jgi:transcriptional regulator with XRE-family HTH domain